MDIKPVPLQDALPAQALLAVLQSFLPLQAFTPKQCTRSDLTTDPFQPSMTVPPMFSQELDGMATKPVPLQDALPAQALLDVLQSL